MKIFYLTLISLLLNFVVIAQKAKVNSTRPSKIQLSWQQMELIMFVHLGPATWQNHEYDDLSTPLSQINPKQLNTDQWAEVAKSFGAKMIIFVAKHTGGFCWWQTETSEYSVRNIPWRHGKGDVMADLSRSCRKNGLKLGVYLSPEDRFMNIGMGGVARKPDFQPKYEDIYKKQLTELLTRYGDINEIWVDGSLVFDITNIIRKCAPKATILQSSAASIRWVGNEMGFAPYPSWNAVKLADARSGNSTADHSDPTGDTWLPIETDVSLRRPSWFWNPDNAKQVLSLEQLLQIYYCSVGRGTNLLINTSPDTTGLIPALDAARLAEFGKEIKSRFEKPVAKTSGSGNVIHLYINRDTAVDHVEIMEDIKNGERIREFRIESLTKDGWKKIFKGTSIGHKLIIQFTPINTSEIRLSITKSIGIPEIKSLKAFYIKAAKVDLPKVKDSWKIRNIGEWELKDKRTAELDLELSSFCKDAQAYEIAFALKDELGNQPKFSFDWAGTGLWLDDIRESQRLKIVGKSLIFDGVSANQYLLNNEKFGDRVYFNLTGIASSIKVKVLLQLPEGKSNAKIQAFLLRK